MIKSIIITRFILMIIFLIYDSLLYAYTYNIEITNNIIIHYIFVNCLIWNLVKYLINIKYHFIIQYYIIIVFCRINKI
ncbi:hypothetical protein [Plasmodium yoelii yoelii]|uniref:Uncharacterized protein n=1 Tax=Plasmodium yoelii yoelii TaxID=73239 RepID=Q7RBC6_PLAYO|nr:hypothetical protein [Plasmodium yoelii yoelii]